MKLVAESIGFGRSVTGAEARTYVRRFTRR